LALFRRLRKTKKTEKKKKRMEKTEWTIGELSLQISLEVGTDLLQKKSNKVTETWARRLAYFCAW
jgi:hypothetical protein